jgi:hypothetical protein
MVICSFGKTEQFIFECRLNRRGGRGGGITLFGFSAFRSFLGGMRGFSRAGWSCSSLLLLRDAISNCSFRVKERLGFRFNRRRGITIRSSVSTLLT